MPGESPPGESPAGDASPREDAPSHEPSPSESVVAAVTMDRAPSDFRLAVSPMGFVPSMLLFLPRIIASSSSHACTRASPPASSWWEFAASMA